MPDIHQQGSDVSVAEFSIGQAHPRRRSHPSRDQQARSRAHARSDQSATATGRRRSPKSSHRRPDGTRIPGTHPA